MKNLASYRKALAALAAALGVIVSSGLLHGTALAITNVVIAVIGAVAVYLVPNEPLEPVAAPVVPTAPASGTPTINAPTATQAQAQPGEQVNGPSLP